MRQSVGGEATTASTAAAKLRLPALTQTARLPPNSGTVCALFDEPRRIGRERIAIDSAPAQTDRWCRRPTVDDFFARS